MFLGVKHAVAGHVDESPQVLDGLCQDEVAFLQVDEEAMLREAADRLVEVGGCRAIGPHSYQEIVQKEKDHNPPPVRMGHKSHQDLEYSGC